MSCEHRRYPDTALRCGKCDALICPDCMVETPVGARCRECARLYRLPTFRLETRHYLVATLVGLLSALVTGFIWAQVAMVVRFFFTNFVLAYFAGLVIGEVISRSVNRKRGLALGIIAGLATALSYFVAALIPPGFPITLLDLLFLIPGIVVAANRVR